jgi:hypothetical protein
MELFTQLFGDLLAFVYHCFDRIVIYGYLSGLARPEQIVHFFRQVVGVPTIFRPDQRGVRKRSRKPPVRGQETMAPSVKITLR